MESRVVSCCSCRYRQLLNVIQVADNQCNKLNAVQRIENELVVGAQLADRIVTFAKNSEQLCRDFAFSVSGTGIFKFVITDLKAGNWQVKKDGRVFIPLAEVRASEGVLSLKVQPGIMSSAGSCPVM